MSNLNNKTAFLFSGQGSQYVGMGKELYENYASAKEVFDCADKILGYSLSDICFNGPEEELNKTVNSQPAIMATSLAALAVLREKGIDCSAVAGHSLGEYAAMVASGVVTLEDGFALIKERALAMQKAAEENKGAMCAVLKLTAQEVEEVCAEVDGYVVAVNYNSPAQTVIAGEVEAVDKAIELFTAKKARCMKLNVASAFHSDMMKSASEQFLEKAKSFTFSQAKVDFYSNVLGKKLDDFSDMPAIMAKHIISPVKFTSELAQMTENGIEYFIELGPKNVLTGLVKKTLDNAVALSVENEATLSACIEKLTASEE